MTLNLMLRNHLCIKFGGQQVMSEVLYLGKSRIEWVSSVKHLGNYVNSDMTDKTDMKCSSFIGYVNKLLYIRSDQFLYNMYNSHNSIVQTCFMNALYNSNSVIGLKIAYFRAKYRVNFTTSTCSTIMSSIRVTVPTEDQTVSINNLFSLLSARSDLSFIEGFNLVEIIEMIGYVSTS